MVYDVTLLCIQNVRAILKNPLELVPLKSGLRLLQPLLNVIAADPIRAGETANSHIYFKVLLVQYTMTTKKT